MDVSNSTGENTGYRVVGGGQAPTPVKGGGIRVKAVKPLKTTLHEGTLEPNTYVTLPVPNVPQREVHFHRGGTVIAKQKVPAGDCGDLLVALVPNGEGAHKPFVCRKKTA